MSGPLFVKVTRAGGVATSYQAQTVAAQVGSDLSLVDSTGQGHTIPAADWTSIEIRRDPPATFQKQVLP